MRLAPLSNDNCDSPLSRELEYRGRWRLGGRVIRLEECTAECKVSFVEIRLKLRLANPFSSLGIPFNLRAGEISTLHTKRAISLCESSMRSSLSITRKHKAAMSASKLT